MTPVIRTRLIVWWQRFAAWMMQNPPHPLVRHCPNDWPVPKLAVPRVVGMN
jgi:hypothetical protein